MNPSLIGVTEEQYLLKVSPNPSLPGQANITFRVKQAGNIRVSILDEAGHTIDRIVDGRFNAGNFEYKIQRGLRPGTYFCHLQVEMVGVTRRFSVAE